MASYLPVSYTHLFKVVGEDAYFLAWTTTPWTLPSNVALCVNPNEAYCKVKAADGYTYYMAEALLDTVLGKLNAENPEAPAYEVLETYTLSLIHIFHSEKNDTEIRWQVRQQVKRAQPRDGHV